MALLVVGATLPQRERERDESKIKRQELRNINIDRKWFTGSGMLVVQGMAGCDNDGQQEQAASSNHKEERERLGEREDKKESSWSERERDMDK